MKIVNIDLNNKIKDIKPLHGVNGGPITQNFHFDKTRFFKEANIPFSRTHDIEGYYGGGEWVDIHNIFRDFTRDPDDPTAYNFVLTDQYIKAIIDSGASVLYRLGETIEQNPIKQYTVFPSDLKKWARVCSNIVAHYNKGWANGYHYGITYWEIWNEPEVFDCWRGTEEEMFAMYDAAATEIKKNHPEVKVGGLAFCKPKSGTYFDNFLLHIKETNTPLDFISWHNYAYCMEQVIETLTVLEAKLDKYGYGDLESIDSEWNMATDWKNLYKDFMLRHTAFRASFMAAYLTIHQNHRTSTAIFYDVQARHSKSFGGAFSFEHNETTCVDLVEAKPEKPYYVLKAWNELHKLGTQIYSQSDSPEIYTIAATDGDEVSILVVSFNGSKYNEEPPANDTLLIVSEDLDFSDAKVYVINSEKTFDEETFINGKFILEGNSVALIKARKKS